MLSTLISLSVLTFYSCLGLLLAGRNRAYPSPPESFLLTPAPVRGPAAAFAASVPLSQGERPA